MNFAVSNKQDRTVMMQSSRPSDDELDDEISQLEAKYGRREQIEEEDNDDAPEPQQQQEREQPSPRNDNEEVVPKSQYDNLRSNRDKKINELNQRLKELEAAAEESSAPQPPRSKEELEEWLGTYPETAQFLETWLIDRLGGTNGQIKTLKSELSSIKSQNETQKALGETIAKLSKKHPDWAAVRDDPRWIEWRDAQEDADRIKSEVKDANFLIRTITAFKADVGWVKPKKGKTPPSSNGSSSSQQPRGTNKETIWYASDIDNMTDAEYDKYEADINAARRDGRFRNGRRPPTM